MGTKMPPHIKSVLRRVADSGIAAHWLRPRDKAPIESRWAEKPRPTAERLIRTYQADANIGVRLGEPSEMDEGFLYCIDVDVRGPEHEDAAIRVLAKLLPEYEQCPTVLSGSGSGSRHVYFLSHGKFRSRMLARSDGFDMIWDAVKEREVKRRHYEIELFGTGKQVAFPPSVHPSGNPYRWANKSDLTILTSGLAPEVDAERIEEWGLLRDEVGTADQGGIEPTEHTVPQIRNMLSALQGEWVEDRDRWRNIGFALHHQFAGGVEGFDLWTQWSEGSTKYDARDQLRNWRSFKVDRKSPITMRSVQEWYKEVLTEQMVDDFDDLDDDGADDDFDFTDIISASVDNDQPEAAPVPLVPPAPPPADNWRSGLERNDKGLLKSTMLNIAKLIENDPRTHGMIGFNALLQEIVMLSEPRRLRKKAREGKTIHQLNSAIWKFTERDYSTGKPWTDSHDNALRLIFEAPLSEGGYGITISDRDLRTAVDNVASKAVFHPIREKLDRYAEAWDGVERVERLWIDYLKTPDTPYYRQTALMWCLGAVARAYQPGHKFDFVPILESEQGMRKSTFIEILGMGYTGELTADLHKHERVVESILGQWIIEIPELQGFSKADVSTLKQTVSRIIDKVRLAYDRRTRTFPRGCVFIGSTNDSDYLRDETGGRRFWPIRLGIEEDGHIDTERLKREVSMIWAEATLIYRRMRAEQPKGDLPLYLTDPEAEAEAKAQQFSRKVISVEEQMAGEIAAWLDTPIGNDFDDLEAAEPVYRNDVCVKQVWVEMYGREPSSLTQRDSNIITAALRSLSDWGRVTRAVRTKRYGPQRVFRRKRPPPSNSD